MIIFNEYWILYLQTFLLCLFLTLCGFIFKKVILNYHDTTNLEENSLYGFVLIGFLALFINFFFPLSLTVNNILFLLLVYVGFKFGFFNQNKKKLLKKIICVSSLSFILILHSNVNTPDALLYHLPYSKLITEHKIVIGASNLHFRYGFISIFQYVSSFFNNSLFKTNGLLLPVAILVSNFLFYLFKVFRNDFKKESSRTKSYFIFLILIFSLYSFNRYSGYGNDTQAHLYYFVVLVYLFEFFTVKKNFINFQKILIFSLFSFLLKPFYIILILVPFLIFFMNKAMNKVFKTKFFIFITSFFVLWILKTFLITGCFMYPLKSTCYKNAIWFDYNVDQISIMGEAWAKAWPQNLNKSLDPETFIKSFNWIDSWSKIHFKIILKKLTPILLFIIFNFLFFYFTKCLKKNYQNKDRFFYFSFFLVSLFFVIIWFLKIPLYRQGLALIYGLILFLSYFIFIRNINLKKIIKFYSFFIFFIILVFSGVVIKNILRISKDFNQSVSPILYDNSNINESQKVFNEDNDFTHYKITNNGVCGFSISPCTSFSKNVKKKHILGYLIYSNF